VKRWLGGGIVSGSALLGGLAAIVVLPGLFKPEVERFVGPGVPYQFYGQLDGDLLDDYGDVVVVAHNSGNAIQTAEEALVHGADAVEIDVQSSGGRLYASHDSPWPIIGNWLYPRPTLDSAFDAAQSKIVMLDLKGSPSGYSGRLAGFLDSQRRDHRQVIVVSEKRDALEDLRGDAPWVGRFASIGTYAQLTEFEESPEFVSIATGVSVRHTLLDEETVLRLKGLGLKVYAWTVNDLDRVNDLVRLDVDGITTDNLAVMELLGEAGESIEPDPSSGLT
jgi:glycerophosphoryl diester phosphodiesterase